MSQRNPGDRLSSGPGSGGGQAAPGEDDGGDEQPPELPIDPPPSDQSIDRQPARIGFLFFKYEVPEVNVTTEANTVEHQTIDDTVIVQQLGSQPDAITINAVVAEWETEIVDLLTEVGVISLRTERWSGDVIVESTDTTFMRAVDKDNQWLHDATISCLEVNRA